MPETKRTATGVLGGLAGLVGLSAVAGVLITATVTPAIAVSSVAASKALSMFENLPRVLEIDQLALPTTFYYKVPGTDDWAELTKFYDQNRIPVTFNEVATVMYDAILSSEDPRFYDHGGVDLIGTTRAIVQNMQGGRETQGGSSISQQYVKNVLIQQCFMGAETFEEEQECFTAATLSSGTEGYQRKLQEMRYAIQLEKEYSKDEILVGYLDIANWGGRTYGIGAASSYYFGTTPAALTVSQAATLAGIVQNPNTYRIDMPGGTTTDKDGNALNGAPDGVVEAAGGDLAVLDKWLSDGKITEEQYLNAADGYTQTKGRQLYVLGRMLADGKITQAQYEEAALEPITPNIVPSRTGCDAAGGSAYFCKYVQTVVLSDPAFGETEDDRKLALARGGLNIYTTLNLDVQLTAEQGMAEYTPAVIPGMDFGAAAVSVEAKTGRIIAMAQNTVFSEDKSKTDADPAYSSLVYAADEMHGGSIGFAVGSTYKLFTLVDWLENGHSLNEVVNGTNKVFTKLKCDGAPLFNNTKIGNYRNHGGYTSTVLNFTTQSLNSGYLAMAEQLDVCEINRTAEKMGVHFGNLVRDDEGRIIEPATQLPITSQNVPYSVLGSQNIAPLEMASAFASVANNGILCEPKAIDRVTDAEGNDLPIPETSCDQVIAPEVAATAAYALERVMTGNGTGTAANPRDGVPVLGKTGTHNTVQSMMVESSTEVATAVWAGNVQGEADIYRMYGNGWQVSQMRFPIARMIQGAANSIYGGGAFPAPDQNLIRQVLTDLPNVVGMPVAQAQETLEAAGFEVVVGAPIDSPEAEGIVAAQDPGAGKVAGGATVTISPSTGQGVTVPDVTGDNPEQAAEKIRRAGFLNATTGTCTVDEGAGGRGRVTGTSPGAGTVANRNTPIAINYVRDECP